MFVLIVDFDFTLIYLQFKGKSNYEKYSIQQSALPRTSSYRRKLLRENDLCNIQNQQDEEEFMSRTQNCKYPKSENVSLQGCTDDRAEDDYRQNTEREDDESESASEDESEHVHLKNVSDGIQEEMEYEHSGHHGSLEQEGRLIEQSDDLVCNDLVYPGACLTKGKSLFLIMACTLRHNLSGVALQDFLTLFNQHNLIHVH